MPLGENDQVVVLRQHLEEMYTAIARAHSYFSALDLADAYRLGNTNSSSKIANILARAYNHAEGYLYDGDARDVTPAKLILP